MAVSNRTVDELVARIAELKAERQQLRDALKLARSIAESGERVSPGDKAIFDAALRQRSKA